MVKGTSKQITIENAEEVEEVTYASSNTDVATVDSNGTIQVPSTATEGETANITITGKKSGKTRTITIQVKIELKIGDTVNMSTTLNGVNLNNWKVFYKEGDYTYLILADYLPNSAVNISEIQKNGSYNVYSNANRDHLLNAMTTKTNWNSLLKGSINGKSYDYTTTTDEKIYANGSPTLELYVKSWNEKYPSNKLYTRQDSTGYYVGTSSNPSTTYINMSNSDTLYYPHTSEWSSCYGYWLASPCANYADSVVYVRYNGYVSNTGYHYANVAARPLVCLPSNILE